MPSVPHVPAATGPRLQSGDLLIIGGRQCRVRSLLKTKVVCALLDGCGRDFNVTSAYALAHRCRAPRLPSTNLLLQALRRGLIPGEELVAAAAGEGHLDALDRHGSTALLLAVQRGQTETARALLARGARA